MTNREKMIVKSREWIDGFTDIGAASNYKNGCSDTDLTDFALEQLAAYREQVKAAIERVRAQYAEHWFEYDENTAENHQPYNVWVASFTSALDALKAELKEMSK